MNKNIDDLYNDLRKHVTEKRLKEISVDIINSYKSRDHNALKQYAGVLEFDPSGMNISRLFARIIQHYHPDKTSIISGAIERNYEDKNIDELQRLRKIYIFKKLRPVPADKKYDIDIEETYSYSDEYFGRSEETPDFDIDEDFESDDQYKNVSDLYEYGFIEAVNSLFFGGTDDTITPEDLNNIEGELDLSDSEIFDLKGVEKCRNITILNLSGNRIEKVDRLAGLEMLECLYLAENSIESIDCLGELHNLKELDISFNNISNIDVLLKLDELVYVNIMENPVKNKDIIKMLELKGVIVIY